MCELEAKVTELQATITNKELCLERALADADHLKAQLAKKEEQVGWGLVCGWDTRQGNLVEVKQVDWVWSSGGTQHSKTLFR